MNIECTIASSEALVVICRHEKIFYTTGVGPNGPVLCVLEEHEEKLKKAIKEWYEAIIQIHTEVKKYFELQTEQIMKGAEILSDKGYEVSTLEDYEEFVRKRNER
jgi:hypothetical protein